MAKLLNLARVVCGTVGTGTLSLGAAIEGFKTFADAGAADGDILAYSIRDGASSEIGYGTYSAGTLTRTVRSSTNNDNAISLSGNAEVFSTPSASEFTESAAADDVDNQIVFKAAVFN
jgi:hypothetical protein